MTDNQVNCRAKFKMVEKPDSPGESSTSSDHTSLNAKPMTSLACLGFFDEFDDDLWFNHRPVLVEIDVNRGQARCAHLESNTFHECPQIYLVLAHWPAVCCCQVPLPCRWTRGRWRRQRYQCCVLLRIEQKPGLHKHYESLGWMFLFPTLTMLSSS